MKNYTLKTTRVKKLDVISAIYRVILVPFTSFSTYLEVGLRLIIASSGYGITLSFSKYGKEFQIDVT